LRISYSGISSETLEKRKIASKAIMNEVMNVQAIMKENQETTTESEDK